MRPDALVLTLLAAGSMPAAAAPSPPVAAASSSPRSGTATASRPAVDVPADSAAARLEQEAIAAHTRGDRPGEMRALEQLTRVRPDYIPARLYLAEGMLQDGLNDAALVHLDAALRLGSREPRVHVLRANALLLRGRLAEAQAALVEADRIQPTVGAGVVHCRLLLIRGDLDGARARLAEVLGRWPESAAAETALGELLRREGDLEGARQRLEAVTARSGEPQPLAHYELALTYRALGRDAEARRSLARFQELTAGNNAAVAVAPRAKPARPAGKGNARAAR